MDNGYLNPADYEPLLDAEAWQATRYRAPVLERTDVAQQDFERRLPGFDWETLQDQSDDGLSNYSRMIGHAVLDGEITEEEGHAAINLY